MQTAERGWHSIPPPLGHQMGLGPSETASPATGGARVDRPLTSERLRTSSFWEARPESAVVEVIWGAPDPSLLLRPIQHPPYGHWYQVLDLRGDRHVIVPQRHTFTSSLSLLNNADFCLPPGIWQNNQAEMFAHWESMVPKLSLEGTGIEERRLTAASDEEAAWALQL